MLSSTARLIVAALSFLLSISVLLAMPPSAHAQAAEGTCVLRDAAGSFLAQIERGPEGDCRLRCNALGADSCQWRGQMLATGRPLPQAMCRVRGGAHRVLVADFSGTEEQCQSACASQAGNAYRYCDWGSERIHSPPYGSECRVRGGAGRDLLVPLVYASAADCRAFCEQYAGNAYRSCQHGNTMLLEPAASSRCEILGGAARPLVTPFYGSPASCQSACDAQAGNPYRSCYYGGSAIVLPPDASRCEIRVADGAWTEAGLQKQPAIEALLYGTREDCVARCNGIGLAHPVRSCRYGAETLIQP